MRTFLLSFLLFSMMTSLGQNFDSFLEPERLSIATTKPIVVRLLPEDDGNAIVYNQFIKKYAEEIFGKDRIVKYLTGKEFIKFVRSKKNRGKYNFIGTYNNRSVKPGETLLYYGQCGYKIFLNSYFIVKAYEIQKKEKFYVLSEADIKFTLS